MTNSKKPLLDFAALRAANAAKASGVSIPAAPKVIEAEPRTLDRIRHLVEIHLSEMTEWETDFCYSQLEYLLRNRGSNGSPRVREVVAQIEDKACFTGCKE